MITVYKASAGSGKTFRLTRDYLLMMLGDCHEGGEYTLVPPTRDNHRSILAITFTNKATDEMKRRIIHELAVLGGLEPGWTEPSPYIDFLTGQLHCTPEMLQRSAAAAHRRLLSDFSFFNVSTIDAFFQNVLRAFANEADLNGNYELDLNNKEALRLSVNSLLSDITHASAEDSRRSRPLKWLIAMMERRMEEGKAFDVFNRDNQVYADFLSLADTIFSEQYMQLKEPVAAYLGDDAGEDKLAAFTKAIGDSLGAATGRLRAQAQDVLRAIDTEGVQGKARFIQALEGWCSGGLLTNKNGKITKYVSDTADDPLNKGFNGIGKKKVPQPSEALADQVQRLGKDYKHWYRNNALVRVIHRNIHLLGLIMHIIRYLEQHCRDNNTFLISSTNEMIGRIIKDDPAPFIYERTGIYLRHYLIDEFQDTSRMQWDNFRPLLAESLGYNNANLIIGDEKQSIYRFRNADPSLLNRQVTADFPANCLCEGTAIRENTNWRSSADVVRFNNSLFAVLGFNKPYSDFYGNVVQQVASKNLNHRGYVRVTVHPKPDKNEETGETAAEEGARRALDQMIDDMRRQLKAGYRGGDIAVLTRRSKEAAKAIDRILKAIETDPVFAGVRVISEDSLAVDSAASVRLVISALRYILSSTFTTKYNRASSRRVAAIANIYEYLYTTGAADARQALAGAIDATENVDTDSGATSGNATLDELLKSYTQFRDVSLSSLVDTVVRTFVSEEVRRRENTFITALVDIVADFCSRGEGDLASFLEWWDAAGHASAVTAPESDRSVRVMTIHKSKGLEFKCVHIPFGDWDISSSKTDMLWLPLQPEWFDGLCNPSLVPPGMPVAMTSALSDTPLDDIYTNYEEERKLDEANVAYVAYTRAVDELCIQFTPGSKGYRGVGKILTDVLHHVSETTLSEVWQRQGDAIAALSMADTLAVPVREEDDETGTVTYTLGAPTTPPKEAEKPRTALDPLPSEVVLPLPCPASRQDLWQQLVSDDEAEEKAAPRPAEPVEDARLQGLRIHEILSAVQTADEIPHAVRRYANRHCLNARRACEIEELLRRELSREEVRQWFKGARRVICERDICLSSSSRRPDRVVWTANGTVDIIDFKTGAPDDGHIRQVREYIQLLQPLVSEPVRGFIWYLSTGAITEVSADELMS